MAKRIYCDKCRYPQPVCICHAVCSVPCQQTIVVLQHPSEAKHAKNTARLLSLCLPKVQVYVGEFTDDFAQARKELNGRSAAVFYPSSQSLALEPNQAEYQRHHFDSLIFIDATWRKAYKIWQRNPWLHKLTNWHFSVPPPGSYHIRKTKLPNALSTLEAVAYVLKTGHKVESAPLYQTFMEMQRITQRRPRDC